MLSVDFDGPRRLGGWSAAGVMRFGGWFLRRHPPFYFRQYRALREVAGGAGGFRGAPPFRKSDMYSNAFTMIGFRESIYDFSLRVRREKAPAAPAELCSAMISLGKRGGWARKKHPPATRQMGNTTRRVPAGVGATPVRGSGWGRLSRPDLAKDGSRDADKPSDKPDQCRRPQENQLKAFAPFLPHVARQT